ncbi:hypothetical protein WJX73_009902 [Symbiochloris irregularis]|uniref:Dolichyl-diphosphooligosaccharide--protein glycosyltransferase subunit 1 n=1 Tax=Symbiochloris irregularis TaxID=706552 RepID=A0AAW1PG08_9CHLO
MTAIFLIVKGEQEVIITSATQEINLNTQAVITSVQYSLLNEGSQTVNHFIACSDIKHAQQRAFFEGVQGDAEADDPPEMKVVPGTPAYPAGVSCDKFTLTEPLKSGKRTTVETYAVYTKLTHPRPAEIEQGETQRVVYEGHHYLLSPYFIKSQTTKVKLPSSQVDAYTKEKPTQLSGNTLTYGPYGDHKPFSLLAQQSRMRVHYETNAPFLEALTLTRDIEVSHWGNVYVEERYKLQHTGARHKGTWSRLDYMTKAVMGVGNVIPEFKAVLPAGAHSIYYRDAIGNVSTSRTSPSLASVEVNLRPRYPLLGGWKVDFIFGWSLPLHQAVRKTKGGGYELAVQFSPSITGVVVQDMDIQVALPEGATHLRPSAPHPFTNTTSKRFSYLDLFGRPLLNLHAKNLVAVADDELTVSYRLSSFNLLLEPGLLIGAFAIAFGIAIAFSRSELSLGGSSKGSRRLSGSGRESEAGNVQSAEEVVGSLTKQIAERDKVLGSLDNVQMGTSKDDVRRIVEPLLKDILRKLRQLGPALEATTGFRKAAYQQVLDREASLHKAALQRFDGRSYTGASYTHSKVTEAQLDLLDTKVNDLRAEMTMNLNIIKQGVSGGRTSAISQ